MDTIKGKAYVDGSAQGRLLVSSDPLSFWGGYDATNGEIIDRRHPLSGQCGTDTIMAIPATRGSSTTSAVLLEAIRNNTAPAAFLITEPDTFLVLTAVVAEEMYQKTVPIVEISEADFAQLTTGVSVTLNPGGMVTKAYSDSA